MNAALGDGNKYNAGYSIALGWPDDGKMVVKSLAKTADPEPNKIYKVELLGYNDRLKFTQTAAGLVVELPSEKSSNLTCSLRITGSNLKPATLLHNNFHQ